jgi:hypothetical protein
MSDHARMTPHPVLVWPFRMVWKLTGVIVRFVGCFLAILLGLILMMVGVALSLTGLGLILGIPLFILGLMLLIRGLF